MTRQTWDGMVRPGKAWLGKARLGAVRLGRRVEVWMVMLGTFRRGSVRQTWFDLVG
jgi:hypothetical protein